MPVRHTVAKTDCRALFSGRHARPRVGLHLANCLLLVSPSLSAGSFFTSRKKRLDDASFKAGRRRSIILCHTFLSSSSHDMSVPASSGSALSLVGWKAHHRHPSPPRCFTRLFLSCCIVDLSYLYNSVCNFESSQIIRIKTPAETWNLDLQHRLRT